MRSFILIVFLALAGTLFSQPVQLPILIGMPRADAEKIMGEEKFQDFSQNTEFTNAKFKYLKYIDRIGDETLLVFLSENEVCTVMKLMSGYDNEEARTKQLNTAYKKAGPGKWEALENGKTYTIELKKEEWYFTIVIKLKS